MKKQTIDDVEYTFVVDEGFAPSWIDAIREMWPTSNGPFYVYPTEDPVITLVSNAPLDDDQRYAANHPENWKM